MPPTTAPAITNVLSVDVEEYFQSETFVHAIPRSAWDGIASRVEPSIELLLDLFRGAKARATFFILGWVAERHPDMVRRIAAAGHEIASHGWTHHLITRLSPAEFENEIVRSKELLERLSGKPVLGYRAPTFSVLDKTLWALPILAKAGYRYDSSIFPVRHDRYGIPDAPLMPHRREGLWELPMSVWDVGSARVPVAGGGYFRLYPYAITRHAVKSLNRAGRPAVVYLHPWEFDPGQPPVTGVGRLSTVRHSVGIADNANKLARLLGEFRFGAAADVLTAMGCDLGGTPA